MFLSTLSFLSTEVILYKHREMIIEFYFLYSISFKAMGQVEIHQK